MRSRSGDKQWFDVSCRKAYDAKQTAYHAWCIARNAEHWGQFVHARAEAQRSMVLSSKSRNERNRNTLKHSTCSYKWWETLKGSIFGVKTSIPALRGPGGGLVVTPAEKPHSWALSLTASSVVSCTSLLYLVSLSLDAIIFPSETSALLRLDLDTCGGIDPLDAFPLFLKKVADVVAPKLSIIFRKFHPSGIVSGVLAVC